jgi:hypothetical protein
MATARLHIVPPQDTALDITPEPARLLELLEEQSAEIEHLRALLRERVEVQEPPQPVQAPTRERTPRISGAHKLVLVTAFSVGAVITGSATLASTNTSAFDHGCYAGACHANRDSLVVGPHTGSVSHANRFDVSTSGKRGP